MSDKTVRELIIIGGGPAGYTAALYAARADLEPLVIEGFQWGGQLMITSDVENYPGYPDGVMGPEMMGDFRRQAERFGAEFLTDDVTRSTSPSSPARLRRRRRIHAHAVIVATGASARFLGIPSEERLQGPRRLGVRDLRRGVLPRQGRLRRGRRRHGLRGGAVPDEVRDAGAPRAPARRVPRIEDHGRPRRGPTRSSTSS